MRSRTIWRHAAVLVLTGTALGACNVILGNHTPGVLEAEAGTKLVCRPRACGKNACGVVEDGCGGKIVCGSCKLAGFACVNGACECKPTNCQGRCGLQADDCGGDGIDCGSCGNKELSCGGEFADYCGKGTCTPKTCDELSAAAGGVQCGKVSNGCGALVDCGSPCGPGQTCGATAANTCGVCTPSSCATLGVVCAITEDPECPGVPVDCSNACANGEVCDEQKKCVVPTCVETKTAEAVCGGSCGGTVDLGCGPTHVCGCSSNAICRGGSCCVPGDDAKFCEGKECGQTQNNCGQPVNCGVCGSAAHCDLKSFQCSCATGVVDNDHDPFFCEASGKKLCCAPNTTCTDSGCCPLGAQCSEMAR